MLRASYSCLLHVREIAQDYNLVVGILTPFGYKSSETKILYPIKLNPTMLVSASCQTLSMIIVATLLQIT